MSIQKFNRGDVAEGVLGATLTAKFIKKLQDGSYEVLTDKLMNPATNEKFKIGDIIPKPSF